MRLCVTCQTGRTSIYSALYAEDASSCACIMLVCFMSVELHQLHCSGLLYRAVLWCAAQGLSIDDKSAAKLKTTADELVEERQLALECIGEAH